MAIVRGRHRIFWHGRRRFLVPIVALGAFTLGAVAYSAYGYVPIEQPLCTGYTDDGCILRWAEVPTVEGDLIPQCVTYCPR